MSAAMLVSAAAEALVSVVDWRVVVSRGFVQIEPGV